MFTPALAAKYLAKMENQRRFKRTVAAGYAADMSNGKWTQDLMPIVLDVDGNLINGQHRLTAVVDSGKTIGFWVIRDAPMDVMLRMDQGATRNAGDQLQIHGFANSLQQAAAARLVLAYEFFPGVVWATTSLTDITRSLVVDEVMENEVSYQTAYTVTLGMNKARVNRSVAMALYILAERYSSNAEMWEEFATGVATGIMLQVDDPRMALRNYWIRPDRARSFGGMQGHLLATIKAWNKYVEDQPTKLLKTPRREELPMPKVI